MSGGRRLRETRREPLRQGKGAGGNPVPDHAFFQSALDDDLNNLRPALVFWFEVHSAKPLSRDGVTRMGKLRCRTRRGKHGCTRGGGRRSNQVRASRKPGTSMGIATGDEKRWAEGCASSRQTWPTDWQKKSVNCGAELNGPSVGGKCGIQRT